MKVIHKAICIGVLNFLVVAAGAPLGEAQSVAGTWFVGQTHIIDYPQPVDKSIKPVDKSIDTSPDGIRKLTHITATSRGYTSREWQCLDRILTMESNYRLKAVNGSHYGIGQVRGMKHGTGAKHQIDVVLKYIQHRYQTACNAYRHHIKHHWY